MSLALVKFRVPVVAVACALVFAIYGFWVTGQRLIVCDRLAPQQVQCQVTQSLIFGWLPVSTSQFWLQEVAIESTLCDNTPRGGVRFCHQLTLLGEGFKPGSNSNPIAQPLPAMRTPLTTATVRDKFVRFLAGEGNQQLTFTVAGQTTTYLRTVLLGGLLAVVAWGFWDIQWPPVPLSPLAKDGAGESDSEKDRA